MVDASRHRESYIWIDPPWTLSKQNVRVTGSCDYPDPDTPHYESEHESWGKVVRSVLDGAVLGHVRIHSNGSTEFAFGHAVRLDVSGVRLTREPGMWYDDWYAKS